MSGIAQAWKHYLASRKVANGQVRLRDCPLCGASDFELVARRNDLAPHLNIDRRLTFSDYSLCHDCGGIFAARRETPEVVPAYYGLFADIEHKPYVNKVIPAADRKGKIAVAEGLIGEMRERQLLRPGMAVLHVRCDAGTLLRQIRNEYPDTIVHGLDYFETNIQASKDAGLDTIALLDPAGLKIPFEQKYDLIIVNHVFTHALAPRNDLHVLTSALNPDGKLFFYNENDHDLILNPKSEYFSRVDMISYHKQLLSYPSFERFLASMGLRGELVGRRKFTFSALAWREDHVVDEPVSKADLAATRRLATKWANAANHNRYLIPLAKWTAKHERLKWLSKRLRARTVYAPNKSRQPGDKKKKAAPAPAEA